MEWLILDLDLSFIVSVLFQHYINAHVSQAKRNFQFSVNKTLNIAELVFVNFFPRKQK